MHPHLGPCAAATARDVPLAASGAGSLSHQRDECSGEEPPLGLLAHENQENSDLNQQNWNILLDKDAMFYL